MTSKLTVALLGGSLLLLGACASKTQTVQQTPATAGNEFTRALAGHYKDMSANQFGGQADFWSASERFADKSMRASRGEIVMPDQPGEGLMRDPVRLGPELVDSRARLISALNGGAAQRAPATAARAQASYDCWLDEASDPIFAVDQAWLASKVQNCRQNFDTAMAELTQTAQTPPPSGGPIAQAPQPPRPAPEQSYLVFFDFDKSNITAEGESVLRRAVQNVQQGGSSRVMAIGHADRSGTDSYNQALSQRRADAVRQFLMRQGIPANQIQTAARGETQPLVQTPDGVREPQNRRVEITIDRRVASN